MNLHQDQNAKQLTKIEYNRWRSKGIAFENHMDGDYKFINRTLISGKIIPATQKTDKKFISGYWGDIVTSPLITFGIETENKDLLKMGNNLPTHSSEMICEYNLNKLFYEIRNPGLKYQEKKGDKQGSSSAIIEEIIEEEEEEKEEPKNKLLTNVSSKIVFTTLENFKSRTLNLEQNFNQLKEQKQNTTIYLSVFFEKNLLDQYKIDEIADQIIFESPRFLLDLNKIKETVKNWERLFEKEMNGKGFVRDEEYDESRRVLKYVAKN